MHLCRNFILFLFVLLVAGCVTSRGPHPEVIKVHSFLLTWQEDPTTTMTIDWHASPRLVSRLQYRHEGTSEWRIAEADRRSFPYSNRLIVNRVELAGLKPDATYEFRFIDEDEVYRFRTMPTDLQRPIRFIVGGDLMHRPKLMRQTAEQAALRDPDFAVLGGDLAYADGKPKNVNLWYEYLKVWSETMITKDRRVIPHLAAIGNHEIRGGDIHRRSYQQTDSFRSSNAPFYFGLMAFPGQPGFGVLDFSDYLSLFLLDSDHANPLDGEQAEWLEQALASRQDVSFKIPVYHMPAYPSVRSKIGKITERLQEEWVPIFELHGLLLAFENDSHTYKRTPPIKNGKIHPEGVTYIGDGAWGVRTRRPTNQDAWYIKKALRARHFIEVNLSPTGADLVVISHEGDLLDKLSLGLPVP